MDELMKELFEGWKQGKTDEQIKLMKKRMDSILSFEEIKKKKRILSLYSNVPVTNIRYNEDLDLYETNENEYVVLNEEERMIDIQDAILADLGTFTFDYSFLEKAFAVPANELKEQVVKDMMIGGIFPRDYLLEKIEKTCGMKSFIIRLVDQKMIPSYDFLKNEIHSGSYYIYPH